MQVDPICGRKFEAAPGTPSVEVKSQRYYFCSPRCKEVFEKRAERARLGHLAKIGALLSNGKVRWGIA